MLRLLINTLIISMLVCGAVQAQTTADLIHLYNQAALGDKSKTDEAFDAWSQQLESQGASAVTLIYLGASETLKGRDALMPWNKLKLVEKGIAKIDKGLALIDLTAESKQSNGSLTENHLAQANAATVFTALPDMFGQFDKGYDLFLELLAQPALRNASFAETEWIYEAAINASIRAEDNEQTQQWLDLMSQKYSNHTNTQQATQLTSAAK